jgi:hypothetical protein
MSERPSRPLAVLRRALLPLLLLAAPAAAGAQGWAVDDALDAGDPTYHRPYLFETACELSSIGTDVRFEYYELILVSPVPSDLSADLCDGATGFDTVLYFYQRPDARPGPFDPAQPCLQLVAYDDDSCDSQSEISNQALAAGHVVVVLTSFANGTTGDFRLEASSLTAALGDFLFYAGFERGNANTWSAIVP